MQFQIPVTNTPQTFGIDIVGKKYLITCKYNNASDAGWCLDLADANTNENIVANIPLVTGANLLEGLGYLGIGGALYVTTDGDPSAVPTLDNLGTESFLFFDTVVEENG